MADIASWISSAVVPVGVAIASSIVTYSATMLAIRRRPLLLKDLIAGNTSGPLPFTLPRIYELLQPSFLKESMSIIVDIQYASKDTRSSEIVTSISMSFLVRNITNLTMLYRFSLADEHPETSLNDVFVNGKYIRIDDFKQDQDIFTNRALSLAIEPQASSTVRVNFQRKDKHKLVQLFRQTTMVAPGSRISVRSSVRSPITVEIPSGQARLVERGLDDGHWVAHYDMPEALMTGDVILIHSN